MVVDHLVENLPPNIPVLCMFLEKTPMIPHTPDVLIGSLLRQLVRFKKSAISPGIKDAYKEHSDVPPLTRDLVELLKVIFPREVVGLADQLEPIGRSRNLRAYCKSPNSRNITAHFAYPSSAFDPT
jgi:hypothetical protein